jgi:hypothetical protein
MKTFNLKILAATALGLILPALTYADYLAVKYNTAKPAACEIKYQYYDGDRNEVTCTYVDKSSRPASNNWVSFDGAGCNVRHLDDHESQIYVIPMTRNNCYTGANSTIVGVNVGAVGAKKTYGKDETGYAQSFVGKEEYVDGRAVKDYLDGAVGNGNFSKLDIQAMSKDAVGLRIMLNRSTAGDLGGHYYVYFK